MLRLLDRIHPKLTPEVEELVMSEQVITVFSAIILSSIVVFK